MKERIISGLIFALVMLGLLAPAFFYPSSLILSLTLLLFALSFDLIRAFKEKFDQLKQGLVLIQTTAGFLLGAVLILIFWQKDLGSNTSLVFMLSLILVFFLANFLINLAVIIYSLIKDGPSTLLQTSLMLAASFYLALPLFLALCLFLFFAGGKLIFLLAIFSPWVSDSSAYFVGYLLGKKKILPKLSAKKTWAGFYGGLVGTVAFFFILASLKLLPGYSIWTLLMLGLCFSLASQFGDWLASGIKRSLEIKDFGNLIPGHGALLDRFDSVLLTLPLAFVFALMI